MLSTLAINKIDFRGGNLLLIMGKIGRFDEDHVE